MNGQGAPGKGPFGQQDATERLGVEAIREPSPQEPRGEAQVCG